MSSEESRREAKAETGVWGAASLEGAISAAEYVRGFDGGFGADAPFFAEFNASGSAALLGFRRLNDGNGGSWKNEGNETDFADGAARTTAEARERGVGIAGAGLMGVSIAAAFLGAGFPVLAFDSFASALETAPKRIEAELAEQRRRRGVAESDSATEKRLVAEIVANGLTTSDSFAELAARPVVVETIPEKIKIKSKFYKTLAKTATAPILLTSNTSSICVSDLAAALPTASENPNVNRECFCGFHFFHPVCRRSLVEVMRGAFTAPETVAEAAALGAAIFKTPIIVGDGPGFLVNRMLQPYLNEGLALLAEGVPAARVEAVCRRFGFEAGPLRIMDEIGLDVSLHAGWTFLKAFPERTTSSPILPELTRRERLGRKTRRGFYRFESGTSWADDATLDFDAETLAELRAGETFATGAETVDVGAQAASDEELALRVATAILFESARLVEEGVVDTFREADAGLVLALGFPPEKGGIFYWAAAFGLRRILAAAERWAGAGARFVVPESLRRLASES